jgi:hypothetical protein
MHSQEWLYYSTSSAACSAYATKTLHCAVGAGIGRMPPARQEWIAFGDESYWTMLATAMLRSSGSYIGIFIAVGGSNLFMRR